MASSFFPSQSRVSDCPTTIESCMPKGLSLVPWEEMLLSVCECVCPMPFCWDDFCGACLKEAKCSRALVPSAFFLWGGRLSWLPISPVSEFLLPADYRVFILMDREKCPFRIIWAFFRILQYSLETKLWKIESQGIHNPAWDCFFLFEEIWAHVTAKVTLNILKWQPLPLQLWYAACSFK